MSGRVAAVIPARLGSTRLPAKPLLRETGRYLVQHVHDRVRAARRIDDVVVATDDDRIVQAVASFGGTAMLTSPEHASGTDRVAEVAERLDAEWVINVQGDEPELDPADLDCLVGALLDDPEAICTLAVAITDEETWRHPHVVKVVVDAGGRALLFSRSPLPWSDDFAALRASGLCQKHLGVYAFRRDVLFRYRALPRDPLEQVERLEQLRALRHGIPLRVLEAHTDSFGIDTPDDYRRFVERHRQQARTS